MNKSHQDFDSSPGDLGRDGERLEKGRLLGAESGVLRWDEHIHRGYRAGLSGSGHLQYMNNHDQGLFVHSKCKETAH